MCLYPSRTALTDVTSTNLQVDVQLRCNLFQLHPTARALSDNSWNALWQHVCFDRSACDAEQSINQQPSPAAALVLCVRDLTLRRQLSA
jgi:hypothetical protein